MKRYRPYEIDQIMMMPLDFAKTYPQGSYERFLVETINQLDLTGFESEAADQGGETPYDPRSLLGVIFLGFSTGIFSSRRLSSACVHDFRFVFVGGGSTPEHSTICRFLVNHREAIKALFSQVLYIADNIGLIDYKTIAIDGTKIKGNASKQFTGTVADFKAKKAKIERNIERAMAKQAETDQAGEQQYWEAKSDRYKASRQRIDSFLATAQQQFNEYGDERQQSGTDIDCRILKSGGQFLCGYNAQVGIDTKSGLLVDAQIVDQSNDKQAFPLVAEAIRTTIQPSVDLSQSVYLADNGYFSPNTMDYASNQNLDVYVSDRTSAELYEDPKHRQATIRSRDCRIEQDEKGSPVLICPGGERLTAYSINKTGKRTVYRFHSGVNRSACKLCPYFDCCAGRWKSQRKDFEIDQRMIRCHDFMVRHHEKLHSEKGKRIYSQRMSSVERVFGQIKGNLRFTSFLRRGRDKVSLEWRILAIGFNLRRLFALAG